MVAVRRHPVWSLVVVGAVVTVMLSLVPRSPLIQEAAAAKGGARSLETKIDDIVLDEAIQHVEVAGIPGEQVVGGNLRSVLESHGRAFSPPRATLLHRL